MGENLAEKIRLRKLLVLDSNEESRELLAYLFASHGYEVLETKCAPEAWQALRSENYDALVASTVSLLTPGKAFLNAIQAEFPELAILAISKTPSASLRKRLGALRVSYLERPFPVEALADAIRWPNLKNTEDNRAVPR